VPAIHHLQKPAMALVAYSDSESDNEDTPAPPPQDLVKPKSTLAGLLPPPSKKRKLVDVSSNGARKIVVDLPKIEGDNEVSKPKVIAPKTGGSGLLGFLPAPKRPAATVADSVDKPKQRVLGGAGGKDMQYMGTAPMMDDEAPNRDPGEDVSQETPSNADIATSATTTTFKPQSVSRPQAGPIKTRTIQPFIRKGKGKPNTSAAVAPKEDKKISLFSFGIVPSRRFEMVHH